jgi:membrane fusion protein (multidrug efflux system)
MKTRFNAGFSVVILASCVILLLALATGYYFYSKQKPSKKRPPRPRRSVAVELFTAVSQPLETKISAVGTILSNESVTIKPEVPGKINLIGFEEGTTVQKDEILFTLDSELLEAEYQEVKANFDYTTNQYQRAKKLNKDGIIPSEEFDERLRAYLNAKSRLNTLATRLRKHTLKAPFTGRLGSRLVSIGDYVTAGESLINLEDLSPVKIEFYIPQRFILTIKPGQPVQVVVEPLSQLFEGTIYLIDPQVDPETRSALIRAKVPNPDKVLKPGMFCTVTIVLEKKEDALTVPLEALVSRGEKHFLYIEEEGKAAIRQVQLGIFSEGSVEILDGLKPNERVIVAGLQKIAPGAPVEEAAEVPEKKDTVK